MYGIWVWCWIWGLDPAWWAVGQVGKTEGRLRKLEHGVLGGRLLKPWKSVSLNCSVQIITLLYSMEINLTQTLSPSATHQVGGISSQPWLAGLPLPRIKQELGVLVGPTENGAGPSVLHWSTVTTEAPTVKARAVSWPQHFLLLLSEHEASVCCAWAHLAATHLKVPTVLDLPEKQQLPGFAHLSSLRK